jgi:hypothetical protein
MGLELRIDQVTEEHIEPYARLSISEYGSGAAISQPAHLRWKFLENPQGPSIGIHLYNGTELAGRMVALTRNFQHQGRVFRAAHIVDFLVHSKDRGMNALFQLTAGLKKLRGFDFLIIMAPNPAGAAVWEKFVKMRGYFDLNVAAAPLRPLALLQSADKIRSGALAPIADLPWQIAGDAVIRLAGLLSHVSIDSEWPNPGEFERLVPDEWNERVIGVRTREYLDWRYRRGPAFRYNFYFLREANELCGYLVTRRTVYDGIDCLFIVDAFGKPNVSPAAWRGAVMTAIRQAGPKRPEMAMILGNTSWGPLASVSKLPFLAVPSRLLPRKTTVYAEWMTEPGFDIRSDNFYVALGDSDVI